MLKADSNLRPNISRVLTLLPYLVNTLKIWRTAFFVIADGYRHEAGGRKGTQWPAQP